MAARITRPCEYQGHSYSKGDLVESHEVSAKLIRLKFAEPVSDKVADAAAKKES